jgi:hypothetical protein
MFNLCREKAKQPDADGIIANLPVLILQGRCRNLQHGTGRLI